MAMIHEPPQSGFSFRVKNDRSAPGRDIVHRVRGTPRFHPLSEPLYEYTRGTRRRAIESGVVIGA